MQNNTTPAKWWSIEDKDVIACKLCPRECKISPGNTGYCGVRKNIDGKLFSIAYGYPSALQIDPIEKKPLRHFLPGTRVFSVGCFGCNLGCLFCQNDHLSRGIYPANKSFQYLSPERLVDLAITNKCRSIAFTYNEPTIWAEYIIDTFRVAKENKLGTVLVSNAFINRIAAEELFPLTDAANFDIKGFGNFYPEMCQATLQPVLDTCKYFFSLGKHLEITNLIIPGKNSNSGLVSEFLDWVANELSLDVPIHFSAYFPAYKYRESPRTPPEMLREIRANAVLRGFTRVYLGNI